MQLPPLLLGSICLALVMTNDASSQEGVRSRRPDPPTGPARIAGLIPLGRPVERVRIPSFTDEGLQASVLEADSVTRVDEDELSIDALRIILFDRQGESDVRIEAPFAAYLIRRELLSTPYPVTITKREYFAALGSGLVFDYTSQSACLLGPVTMILDDARRPRTQDDQPEDPGAASRPRPDPVPALPPALNPAELLAAAGTFSNPALFALPISVPGTIAVPEQESLINQTQADFGRLRIEESRLRLLLTPTARELARARQLEAALANLLPAPAIPIQTPTPRARPVEDPDSTSSQEPTPPPDDDILTPPPAKAKLSESYRFITIRCNSRTLLDPKKFIVVFQEDVVLEHPEFRLNCEELVVHRGEGDAEIKKAVATGPMVIIERRNPEGVLEEARCRRAVFENDELVLLDYPQIRRDRVVIRATSPRTRLVIPRNAKAYFDGPSQTIGADKVDDADAENP